MKNGTYDMREDAKSLGKLQDRLNTPCVKFGKPAPKFIVNPKFVVNPKFIVLMNLPSS